MFRRTVTITAAVALAFGAVLLTAPSYAAAATSGQDGQMPPCPLTETQYKQGKKIVAEAVAEVEYGRFVLDTSPLVVAEPKPEEVNWTDASLCLSALTDIGNKTETAKAALDQLGICVAWSLLDGRSCAAEEGNARAALHDLEVAINNLQRTCPWLAPW
jgi:hypothetical protein